MSVKNEQDAKNENEYIDLAKKDLDTFAGYSGSFAARWANHCFPDPNSDDPFPENPFDTFHSDNGYVPDIEDAKKWALGIMKNIPFIGPDAFLNQIQRFFHIQNNLIKKINSGEMSIEKARETAERAFNRINGWGVGNCIYDGKPDSEEWLASQITDSFAELDCIQENIEDFFTHGFDLSKYNQHMCRDIYFKPYEKMAEILKIIRCECDDFILKAFKIGFLYHDAWWKARHEEAARKHYQMLERNKKNGKKGGLATKKRERYAVLNKLARKNIKLFLWETEIGAARKAKALASQYDNDKKNEPIFIENNNSLSLEWYRQWYKEFRKIAKSIQ